MKTAIVVFVLMIGAYFYLIAGQTLFPFVDLPNHLAEATIYQQSSDPVLSRFYQIEKGINPNSFHYLFCSLFDSVETGNKIYYLLYLLLVPASTLLVIRQLGGNWKFSFLTLLLIFNYNVSFGFAGFTMAIPFVLIAFYLACINKTWSQVALAFILLLLFFIHILGLLFTLFLLVALGAFQFKGIKPFLIRIIVIIPALVVTGIWYSHTFTAEQSTLAFLIDYYSNSYFQELYLRSKILVYDNFVLAGGYAGIIIALLFATAITLPVAWKLLSKKLTIPSLKEFVLQHKESTAFLFVSLTCCFFLPDELPGQGILYQRFSVFLFVSLIVTGSLLYKSSISLPFQITGLVIIIIHLSLWADYLYQFDKENNSFNSSLFTAVSPEEVMGGAIIDYQYRGRPVYIHFPNYNIIWNHGVTTTRIIDYRFGSIRRKVNTSVLPEYQEWTGQKAEIPKEYTTLKFLLLKGEASNLPENAVQLAGGGNWKVMKLK